MVFGFKTATKVSKEPSRYAQLEELDRPTLLRLVKRIEVGEKYEIAGETHRDIKIYYNFVGYVEL